MNLEPNQRKRSIKSPRIIPWGWLIGILFSYLSIGYLLAAFNVTYIIWGVAVAGAIAEAAAVVWAKAVAVAVLVAVVVSLAVAWAVIMAVAVVVAWAVAVTVAVAGGGPELMAVAWAVVVVWAAAVAGSGNQLQKSFSRFYTFLILISTSTVGLSLGWLGYKLFNTGL